MTTNKTEGFNFPNPIRAIKEKFKLSREKSARDQRIATIFQDAQKEVKEGTKTSYSNPVENELRTILAGFLRKNPNFKLSNLTDLDNLESLAKENIVKSRAAEQQKMKRSSKPSNDSLSSPQEFSPTQKISKPSSVPLNNTTETSLEDLQSPKESTFKSNPSDTATDNPQANLTRMLSNESITNPGQTEPLPATPENLKRRREIPSQDSPITKTPKDAPSDLSNGQYSPTGSISSESISSDENHPQISPRDPNRLMIERDIEYFKALAEQKNFGSIRFAPLTAEQKEQARKDFSFHPRTEEETNQLLQREQEKSRIAQVDIYLNSERERFYSSQKEEMDAFHSKNRISKEVIADPELYKLALETKKIQLENLIKKQRNEKTRFDEAQAIKRTQLIENEEIYEQEIERLRAANLPVSAIPAEDDESSAEATVKSQLDILEETLEQTIGAHNASQRYKKDQFNIGQRQALADFHVLLNERQALFFSLQRGQVKRFTLETTNEEISAFNTKQAKDTEDFRTNRDQRVKEYESELQDLENNFIKIQKEEKAQFLNALKSQIREIGNLTRQEFEQLQGRQKIRFLKSQAELQTQFTKKQKNEADAFLDNEFKELADARRASVTKEAMEELVAKQQIARESMKATVQSKQIQFEGEQTDRERVFKETQMGDRARFERTLESRLQKLLDRVDEEPRLYLASDNSPSALLDHVRAVADQAATRLKDEAKALKEDPIAYAKRHRIAMIRVGLVATSIATLGAGIMHAAKTAVTQAPATFWERLSSGPLNFYPIV